MGDAMQGPLATDGTVIYLDAGIQPHIATMIEREGAEDYARMFVASRDMLAALEEIAAMKPWTGENPDYGSGHDAARDAAAEIARAAIAKAKGETP